MTLSTVRLRTMIGRGLLVLVAAIGLIAVLPAAANAADNSNKRCAVTSPTTSCKTGTLNANSVYHRLYYKACATFSHYADWQVKDANNGVIVAQGRAETGTCATGFIYGLYGSYWGWVFNTRGKATMYISNYTGP